MASYGRKFLCHNRGPFFMREIIRDDGGVSFTDEALARFATPDWLLSRPQFVEDGLISPDAEPTEVAE